jgi:hypothetical protein
LVLVNGEWSDWSDVGECTEDELLQIWEKTRSRQCNNPVPQYGGLTCHPDQDHETVVCSEVHGQWSEWSISEGDCTQDPTEPWTKSKSRTCTNPVPQYGGYECDMANEGSSGIYNCPPGIPFQNLVNNTFTFYFFWFLVENGDWSVWIISDDINCTQNDQGYWTTTSKRTCTNPEPKYGGSCLSDINGTFSESTVDCEPGIAEQTASVHFFQWLPPTYMYRDKKH